MNSYFDEDLHFSRFEAFGVGFTFLLNSRKDHIQQFIAGGHFYELEELELICKHAGGCKRLLDVGANIGNHSIYLAHRLNLDRVTPIEPHPSILHILRANLGLNWHPSFDLAHLGIGLSDRSGVGQFAPVNELNIGGTRVISNEGGAGSVTNDQFAQLVAGDELFRPGDFDLIKMDIEGMEIAALSGLKECLNTFSGILFVEVHDDNAQDFQRFVQDAGWRKIDEYRRYARCTNWILSV